MRRAMVERDEKGGKKSKNPPQREINIHFTVDYIYINISPKPRPNKYISKCPGLCPGPGAPKSQAPALSPPLPYLRAGHFRAGQGQVGPGTRAWALPCTTLDVSQRLPSLMPQWPRDKVRFSSSSFPPLLLRSNLWIMLYWD